jgi:hypothetical protein
MKPPLLPPLLLALFVLGVALALQVIFSLAETSPTLDFFQ